MTRNGSAAFQIGNGAGNLERAIITTCAQPHFLSGLKHELLRGVFHAEQCINISRAGVNIEPPPFGGGIFKSRFL